VFQALFVQGLVRIRSGRRQVTYQSSGRARLQNCIVTNYSVSANHGLRKQKQASWHY